MNKLPATMLRAPLNFGVTPLRKDRHHASTKTELRMLRSCFAARYGRGSHLFVRMHILRGMCSRPTAWAMSQLWWRTCHTTAAPVREVDRLSSLCREGTSTKRMCFGNIVIAGVDAREYSARSVAVHDECNDAARRSTFALGLRMPAISSDIPVPAR